MTVQDKEANFLNGNDVPTKLKAEAQRFQVRWETLPDHYYVKGQRRQIGLSSSSPERTKQASKTRNQAANTAGTCGGRCELSLSGSFQKNVGIRPTTLRLTIKPSTTIRAEGSVPKSRCKLGFATDRGLIARWMPAKCGAFEK